MKFIFPHAIALVFCLFFSTSLATAQTDKLLFVEAESFADYGGWVLDQQYMDQIGSPVLMAHGIGEPVPDAETGIRFPNAGNYRIFVRTRNWVSPWTTEHAPGRFQLKLDGKPLPAEFGTQGKDWHWQPGGTIKVDESKLNQVLALHDLTGWDGRLDAIIFAADPNFTPPEDVVEIEKLRRKALGLPDTPPNADGGPFDLVVVGAGYPGICAAVGAARLGLNVALIQDRPYVGGNASPEIRVGLAGGICLPPYPNLGNLVYQLKRAEPIEYEVHGKTYSQREMSVVQAEKNLSLHLYTRMSKVEMDGKRIKAVVTKNVVTGRELRFEGKLFADCTGDGNLGFLAGADFRVGREAKSETGESMAPDVADNQIMGSTLLWRTEPDKQPTTFPKLPWAFQFTPESILPDTETNWNWETGMTRDQVAEIERIRDHGFMAAYGHWSYLKNNDDPRWTPKIRNRRLAEVPYIAGKRESRRLMGDFILHEQDFRENRPHPDACVTCTWPIDLHYANEYSQKYWPGEEFRTYCTHDRHPPYPIPYRCFYSRNISNLFMAGRDISVTHVAMGPTRVMQTGGMMGEVVAMAAAVCIEKNGSPRDVYEKHLDDLKTLLKKGVAPPPPATERPASWTERAGRNLARRAKATASSEHPSGQYGVRNVNDGFLDTNLDARRWVSQSGKEHWVELDFSRPTTVNALQVATGWTGRVAPIRDFVLQYEKDGQWIDIPNSRVVDNVGTFCDKFFTPTTAKKFRLFISKTTDGVARIWEWELYRFDPNATTQKIDHLLPDVKNTLLIEAESFDDHGGWSIDQQYMDQMGSPVLVAHGLGKAVRDANTDIVFPAAGTYRVFARTRNWVAPWTTKYCPGRFQLILGGQPIEGVFGTEGDAWHWQAGGTIHVSEGQLKYTLAIRDLTGFDGRVDAICFTADPDFTPPDDKESLAPLRRQALGLPETPPNAKEGPFDLVVVGGGYPGICASISAARLGLKVALIQDRPFVGGNASPEISVGPEGVLNLPPYPNLGNLVYQLRYAKYTHFEVEGRPHAQKEMELLLAEKNIALYLGTRMITAEMDGPRIKSVTGKNIYTGIETRFPGTLFADCTGDANLGFLAGADYRVGRESKKETGESMAPDEVDKLVMGSTLNWDTAVRPQPTKWADYPWTVRFTKETIIPAITGYWNWETGMNMDQVEDVEKLRDLQLRAIYGHWSYMKNHMDGEWAEKVKNRELSRVALMAGKRESRRLLGDVIIQEQDITEKRSYPDACVVCTWPIDLHYADDYSKKFFPDEEFRTYCTHVKHDPYPLPYRCFYSRNVPNLFMAGRNLSVTHVGLGVSRVIQTGGMMGEVVGMAAAVCKRNNALPREVYEKYFGELKTLMEKGIAPPPPPPETRAEWTKTAGENLARKAVVSVSSEHTSELYPAKNLNDGRAATTSNASRWVSQTEKTPWAVLTFAEPVQVAGFQLITGQSNLRSVIKDCVLQYEKGGKWIDVPGSEIVGNDNFYVDRRFEAVRSTKFRLWITRNDGDMARIWELELYGP